MVSGYKIFIGNEFEFLTNFNDKVKVGDILEYDGDIKPYERGYHFALRLEDIFGMEIVCISQIL